MGRANEKVISEIGLGRERERRFVYYYRLHPGDVERAARLAGYVKAKMMGEKLMQKGCVQEALAAGLLEDIEDDPKLAAKVVGRVAEMALSPEDKRLTLDACVALMKHFRILYGQEKTGGDQVLNIVGSVEGARRIMEKLGMKELSVAEMLERDTIGEVAMEVVETKRLEAGDGTE